MDSSVQMDSEASQVAAVSQAPAQPVVADSGMRRPSVASRKNEDKAEIFWLFLVSLKDVRFFKNKEASIRYHRQFLMNVLGRRASERPIVSSYYEYINAFVIKLTKKESKIFRGNEEKCKTKMVTIDDKSLPLPGTKLFLIGLNTKPLFDKFEDEYNDEEASIAESIDDEDEACLVYHKKFLEKAFGSYSRYGLNAFVLEVRDTDAERWRGLFERLAEVEYIRDVKKREVRSMSAISTSALPMSLSL